MHCTMRSRIIVQCTMNIRPTKLDSREEMGLRQCGQLNSVRSRRRRAKLLGSRSRPVSTSLSLAGHTNFSTAITTLCAVYRNQAALVAHQDVVMGRFTTPHGDAAPRLFLPASNSCCSSVTQTASAASREASTVGPRPTASRRSSKIFVSKARRQSRSLSRNVRRTRAVSI
jgi:hypothetical protein